MSTVQKNSTQVISVMVSHVRHTSDGFSVYKAQQDEDLNQARESSWREITVKQFTGPVSRGQRWTLAGKVEKDEKWGEQFAASFATLGVPRSPGELQHMLSSGLVDGWGWRAYAEIEDKLGAEGALEACVKDRSLLDSVPQITEQMRDSLVEALRRGDGMASIYSQLAEWEVKGRLADKLVKFYGFSTVDRLQENPYADILAIDGYGWKSADSIGNRLGILAHDERRVKAGLAVAIYEQTWASGHTWLSEFELCRAASVLLHTGYQACANYVDHAIDEGQIVFDGGRLYPAALHRAEQRIADRVIEATSASAHSPVGMVHPIPKDAPVSEEQRAAVRMALNNRLSLLTGGPGVGKTTTLKTLVQVASEQGLQPTCMAPTGKAASRMTQATGYPATTIHSKLKLTPGDFSLGGDVEPLTGLVIVDEVSMLDTTLAGQLLSRVDPSAHLLLVGDPDQLPSVGPGTVLRDLLDANVLPRMHLDKVYRNEAGIAVNAARIRAGENVIEMDDVFLLEATSPAHAAQVIQGLLSAMLVGGIAREDILVLTPTNDGPSGRYSLNNALQPLLNSTPPGEGIRQYAGTETDPEHEGQRRQEELRRLDRVMVTKNIADLGVFNGQVGTVVNIEGQKALSVDIEGRVVRFSGEHKRSLMLAYAITGHKSQGSEAKIVIAAIFKSRVLSREWLYTVLTRARERCYLIGDMDAIQGCLAVLRSQERRTGLVSRIHAGLAAVEQVG